MNENASQNQQQGHGRQQPQGQKGSGQNQGQNQQQQNGQQRSKKRRRFRRKRTPLSKSVGAVVLDANDRVLIVFQEKNKYWEFPKGKVENEETEMETLSREIEEETGITEYDVYKHFRKVMHYEFQFKGRTIRRKIVYYLIRTNQLVSISDEHSEFEWLEFEQAKKRLKHKNQIKLLEKALKRISNDTEI